MICHVGAIHCQCGCHFNNICTGVRIIAYLITCVNTCAGHSFLCLHANHSIVVQQLFLSFFLPLHSDHSIGLRRIYLGCFLHPLPLAFSLKITQVFYISPSLCLQCHKCVLRVTHPTLFSFELRVILDHHCVSLVLLHQNFIGPLHFNQCFSYLILGAFSFDQIPQPFSGSCQCCLRSPSLYLRLCSLFFGHPCSDLDPWALLASNNPRNRIVFPRCGQVSRG